jgi:ADP-heptose:LPS heptosyltransferase
VYLMRGLGDAVLLLPALRALSSLGPAEPIGVLMRRRYAALFRWATLPLRIHLHEEEWIERDVVPKGPLAERSVRVTDPARTTIDKERLVREIEACNYSVAADLGWQQASGLDGREWLAASGAQTRLGWLEPEQAVEASGLSFGAKDSRVRAEMHWSEYLLEPFAPYGALEPVHSRDPFRLPPRAVRLAELRWPPGSRRLLIVPGSAVPDKNWPPGRFAEIARWARAELGASVLALGAPWESDLIAAVGGASYTGRSLALAAALVRSADAVLTNDTGPAHLAFAMGKPTVALYSMMPPNVWGPGRRDPRFVLLSAESQEEWRSDAWAGRVRAYVAGLLMAARS